MIVLSTNFYDRNLKGDNNTMTTIVLRDGALVLTNDVVDDDTVDIGVISAKMNDLLSPPDGIKNLLEGQNIQSGINFRGNVTWINDRVLEYNKSIEDVLLYRILHIILCILTLGIFRFFSTLQYTLLSHHFDKLDAEISDLLPPSTPRGKVPSYYSPGGPEGRRDSARNKTPQHKITPLLLHGINWKRVDPAAAGISNLSTNIYKTKAKNQTDLTKICETVKDLMGIKELFLSPKNYPAYLALACAPWPFSAKDKISVKAERSGSQFLIDFEYMQIRLPVPTRFEEENAVMLELPPLPLPKWKKEVAENNDHTLIEIIYWSAEKQKEGEHESPPATTFSLTKEDISSMEVYTNGKLLFTHTPEQNL